MNLKRYVVMGLLLLATGCEGKESSYVSEKEFGELWPLTVPDGIVSCVRNSNGEDIITFIVARKEYSLNEIASRSGKFLPIKSIGKPEPANSSVKKNISVLFEEGRKNCIQ